MLNKKGFTLIELLAVIVILAIILVIAVPQINKVIEDSRGDSLVSSVKMMASSIETAYVSSLASSSPMTTTPTDYSTSCPAAVAKWDTANGTCTYNLTLDGDGTPTVSVRIVGAGKFAGLTAQGTTSTAAIQ